MTNEEVLQKLREQGTLGCGYGVDKRAKPKEDLAAVKAAKAPVAWGALQYFPRALIEVSKVSAFGCKKYDKTFAAKAFLGPDYPIEGYDDAMVRHLLARFTEGPVNQADGGVLHRAQIVWCALAALEKELLVYEDAKSGGK